MPYKFQGRWQRTTQKFYGQPCVEFKIKDGTFIGLSGPGGDIWEFSPGHLRAIVTDFRLANKIIKTYYPTRTPSRAGDETLFSFTTERLPYFVRLLRVPRESGRQLRYASSFPALPRKTSSFGPKIVSDPIQPPNRCSESQIEYSASEESNK